MLRNIGIALGIATIILIPLAFTLHALGASDAVRLVSYGVLVGAASVIGVLLEERRLDRLSRPPHRSSGA